MSKYGIFGRKLLKYALRAEKMAASALRADSTLSPTLQQHVHKDAVQPHSSQGIGRHKSRAGSS